MILLPNGMGALFKCRTFILFKKGNETGAQRCHWAPAASSASFPPSRAIPPPCSRKEGGAAEALDGPKPGGRAYLWGKASVSPAAAAAAADSLTLAFLARTPRPLLRALAGSPATSMAAARQRLGSSSSSSSKKRVDYFYDVLSPYSWLAFEVLCRYRPIWNMELRFRPVFLAGIMHATGNKAPALVPKKGEYMSKDIPQLARFYQVPLHLVKDFFGTVIEKGSLKAMRFVTAVDMAEPQFVESVSRELWMRIWSRDEDITQPESILAAAERAGLSSDKARQLLEMTNSPEVKNRLRATNEEALKYGAFGLPCFVTHVNEEPHLFFGSDRLELLANLLGEKWLGPVPTPSKL